MKNNERVDISLSEPITVGKDTITSVQLRKPQAGELRGIKLLDIMQMDVGAYMPLLPRITAPALTEQQVGQLDPADLLQVMNGVQSFFLGNDTLMT